MYVHFLVLESITVAELPVILTGLSVRKKVAETASDTAYVFPGRPPVTGRGKENDSCACMSMHMHGTCKKECVFN